MLVGSTALCGAALVAPATPAQQVSEPAAEPPSTRAGGEFADEIEPLLATYCFRCHGEQRQKADVRLDVLDPGFVRGGDAEGWHAALDMINSGEMPPEDQLQPTDEQRRQLVGWITDSLADAAQHARGTRQVVLRRLNKQQYTNTLQDLLGLSIDFGQVLPDDGKSRLGFSNNGQVLQSSPLLIDHYQAIARQALEQAIVVGDKPEVAHYRVTFGRGRGAGLVAARTGGYQSVPLSTDDFFVEILDAQGLPRVGADEEQQASLDALKRRITVGLRGSSQSRFRTVDDGLVLYSALPHKEKVPKAWQGPSPNLKLELQRCFPQHGDFVMRVSAARGALFLSDEELLLEMEGAPPQVRAPSGSSGVVVRENAIVLSAFESGERENLVPAGAALVPQVLTEPARAEFELQVASAGYYQVDLVHPPAPSDAMPSVRLGLGALTLDMRSELSEEQLGQTRVVTTLGAAHLRAKRHELSLGGPFFVGFSHLVLTPLPEDHELLQRLRIENDAATRALQQEKTPWLRAFIGTRTDDGMDYAAFGERQVVEAPLGEPRTYSFHGRLENLPIPEPESGDTEILSGFLVLGVWNDHLVKQPGDSGPPLSVESIEFEAPYLPVWPPESHTRIFLPSNNEGDHEDDRELYTREVVGRFAERAFRRPVSESELERYMEFWRDVAGDYEHYEEGVREVLVAMLCSPHFLYLVEPSAELVETELATRLSYFLWNSPPDETLRELADSGRLAGELEAQVDRLLDDERVWRFVRVFGREWLRLDRHEQMTVDPDRYPTFTRFVKQDLAEETYQYLHEVLSCDLSLLTLIDSDFAMLNQNLAEFYGVEGVEGAEFRRVAVAPEQRRGGLLTQAAFLSGHSDGTRPHPIKRAVWVKERLLGDPPPPPPPNVPELDPEAPGFENLTLKQQLERHRDSASCVDCHRAIDPYGVVFERYDAAGLFRPEQPGSEGQLIDASSTLEDGTLVDGVDGLVAWLLAEQQADAFAEALVRYLFSYALGRDVSYADEPEIAAILARAKSEDYRLRTVIRGIVTSPSFLRP